MGAAPPVPVVAAPRWVQSSTAAARPLAMPAPPEPPAASNAEASDPQPTSAQVVEAPPVLPTVQSPDGRLVLTNTHLTVAGQTYSLRELERAEVAHVRWVLWILIGGLGLAGVLIGFLENWLHTLPAALGMLATAALLAYGQRGTNRLRLWRLGPLPLHAELPGELAPWQRLVAELNRRIARAHDHAAAEAAALLATAAESPAEPAPDEPANLSAN